MSKINLVFTNTVLTAPAFLLVAVYT